MKAWPRGWRIDGVRETRTKPAAFDDRNGESIMAARNRPSRNLWIIAALVVATAALLAWLVGLGGGMPGGGVADVGVAPPPGRPAPAAGGS